MKKLIKKLRRQKTEETPSRITNETIAEHREKILAGGRRFKYPVQYARHKLVINVIAIAVGVLVLVSSLVYWQLYHVQSSSDLMYRVTRVLPLPVASVDGEQVSYSDYLMKYRSSLHFMVEKEQISLKTDDGKQQADYYKQKSMEYAISGAYAAKLARQYNLSVSSEELQQFLTQQRESYGSLSESSYNAIFLDAYNWSPDEYEHVIRNELLRVKVAYQIDQDASAAAESAKIFSNSTQDLKKITEQVTAKHKEVQATYGISGMVPKDNKDGGLAKIAATLQPGQLSDILKPTAGNGKPATGDGYYIIKVLESTESSVSYEYIHIALGEFNKQLKSLEEAGKINEYITIPKTDQVQESAS
jgi:hypothetical protein